MGCAPDAHKADEDLKFSTRRPEDQRTTGQQDERYDDIAESNRDLHKLAEVERKACQPLFIVHVLGASTHAQFEKSSCLNVADPL